MIYAVIAIFVLIGAVMLLRLRIRCRLDSQNRLLFVGLGRTGPEFDFVAGKGVVRLFGVKVKSFTLKKETAEKAPEPSVAPEVETKAERKKPPRVRPLNLILEVVRASLMPSFMFLTRLLRSLILEEFNGTVRAGFDTPDLTGQAYGYYQAVLGAVPALAGRVTYYPDWTGQSFDGQFRASAALPLYRLAFRLTQYLFSLPLRKIIRLAIGTKKEEKGVQDV